MIIHRTNRMAIMAVVLVGIIAAACSSTTSTSAQRASTKAPVTLNVGYIASLTAAGVPAVGQALGLWTKVPGVKFNFVPFTTGPAETEALAGGSINIENIGGGPAMLGIAGYGKLIAVDNVLGDNYVIGDTAAGTTSIASLRGKSVGYPEGTTAQLLLAVALHDNGMTMSDIKGINLQPATMVSAMSSNEIQAAAIYLPFAATIEQDVSSSKIIAKLSNFSNLVLPQFWVASNSIIKEHPAAVKSFLRVAGEAINYRSSHLQKAAEDVLNFTKAPSITPFTEQAAAEDWITTSTILKDYESGTAQKWVSNLLTDLTTYGIAHSSVTASQLTDFTLDEQTLKAGVPKV